MKRTSFDLHPSVSEKLVEHLPGMFFKCLCSQQQMLIYVSENSLNITGYSPDELIGNKEVNYRKLIHYGDAAHIETTMRQAIESKTEFVAEYRIICRMGRQRWVKEIANPIYDSEGNFLFMEGYIDEITQQKDASIITSTFTSYQKAINKSSIVSLTDTNGVILYVNELFCEVSKYTRSELVGNRHNILNSGYHDKDFFKELWQTILRGDVWRGEVRNKAKDGTYYWVDSVIVPVTNENGDIKQFLSIRNLITDRVEALEQLAESVKFTEGILDAMDSQIAVIDRNGKIVATNQAWQNFYQEGTSFKGSYKLGDSYINHCLADHVYGSSTTNDVHRGLQLLLKNEIPIYQTEFYCKKDKHHFWFLLTASHLKGNSAYTVIRHIDITQRKFDEIKLYDKQAELQTIIDNVPGAVYSCELAAPWLVKRMSVAVEDITGYSADEFLSGEISWGKLVFKDDLPYVESVVEHAVEQKIPFKLDYRIIHKNGAVKWVYEIGRAKYNSGNEALHLEGNIFDITDRKFAEISLSKSNEQFKNLIENISGVYWINDLNKRSTIYISPAFERIWGISCDELYSDPSAFINSIHPDDKERIIQAYSNISNEKSAEFQYRIISGNKEVKYIQAKIKVVKGIDGSMREFGYAEEITDTIMAEQRMRENEIYLSAVFDTVNDAIITVTLPDRKIININRATEKLFGYSKDEMLDRNTQFLFPGTEAFLDYGRHMNASWQQPGGDFTTEIQLVKKNGEAIWCDVQTSELNYGDQQVTKAVTIIHDITERKQNEEQLNKLIKDLTHQLKQNTQFNYIISHNLRAPLSNILGLSSIFDEAGTNHEILSKIIEGIKISAEKIDQTIKDLNDVLSSKSYKGQVKEWVDVRKLIDEQLQVIDAELREKADIRIKVAANSINIKSVKSYLESIFYNLINNAFKYTDKSRSLVLSINTAVYNDVFLAEVTDNGIGMDLHKLGDEIFSLYKRFNFDVEGKGLGLHMVKMHIESLGGSIHVESQPGSGTTFRFSIPLN
ncbi:PAS domain S-box protein [bacterium]|nr:PAS domain S-box protein [bacterium]